MEQKQADEEGIQEMEDDTQSEIPNEEASKHEGHTTRSGRTVSPPDRLNLYQQHVESAPSTKQSGRAIANAMHYNNAMKTTGVMKKHLSFAETFSLKAGLKKFGKRGYEAAAGEMKQLHDRAVFKTVDISTLSPTEKKKTMRSLIFLTEKRDGTIKARTCADGSKARRDYKSDRAGRIYPSYSGH